MINVKEIHCKNCKKLVEPVESAELFAYICPDCGDILVRRIDKDKPDNLDNLQFEIDMIE
jgi:predicted RNA-binding Zn-ribbon protein involved in translation (DUF1610 family)